MNKSANNKREYRYLPLKGELRFTRNEDGTRTISGYAAKFNTLSNDFGDGWFENIVPGAFSQSLSAGADVRFLHEHDPLQGLLARTKSGTLKLSEDSIGLKVDATLPNTTLANDVCASIEAGDLDAFSFGFICRSDRIRYDEGKTIRDLVAVDLFDVSVTAWPAYSSTELQLRSLFPDGSPVKLEARSDVLLADCSCPCPPCQSSDCSGCVNDDCEFDSCVCRELRTIHMRLRVAVAL